MIKSKNDLKRYLASDKAALEISRKHPKLIGDRIWKYQRAFRKTEYYVNNANKNIFTKVRAKFFENYWKYKSHKWGNEFPVNTVEEGLHLWHGQNIIINPAVRIGKNAQISTGVIVGQAHGKCPTIGDNVNLSVDCKVLGGINITHDVVIGAGAVVVKDIDTPFSSWGGVPAHLLTIHKADNDKTGK